ncbi:MAG TPA: hypothetical protein VFQ38_16250 [Longimicrobiales bacterium]|nr:hypothetical protein [Longimicrobiales bacterium]
MRTTHGHTGWRGRVRAALERPGLSAGQERIFNATLAVVVALFVVGWSVAIAATVAEGPAAAPPTPLLSTRVVANPLAPDAAPDASYVLGAATEALFRATALRGESGKVRVVVTPPGGTLPFPDTLPPSARIGYRPRGGAAPPTEGVTPPRSPGIWNVVLRLGDAAREVPDLSVITLVPLSAKRGGRIGAYRIGSWPYERGGRPRSPAYQPPAGLVRVTPGNLGLPLSEHIRLGDFVTKGQTNVWPKYVALQPRVLDKVELTLQELEREGHPVEHLGVISAFRTPNYNETGGNPAGRAALSRHMYGDAMDLYIDNDRNGCMDDLNGDGKADVRDARILGRAAERVEREHPSLVGGVGVYAPTGAHCGFVHIDTRGYRARWGPWG